MVTARQRHRTLRGPVLGLDGPLGLRPKAALTVMIPLGAASLVWL